MEELKEDIEVSFLETGKILQADHWAPPWSHCKSWNWAGVLGVNPGLSLQSLQGTVSITNIYHASHPRAGRKACMVATESLAQNTLVRPINSLLFRAILLLYHEHEHTCIPTEKWVTPKNSH